MRANIYDCLIDNSIMMIIDDGSEGMELMVKREQGILRHVVTGSNWTECQDAYHKYMHWEPYMVFPEHGNLNDTPGVYVYQYEQGLPLPENETDK